MRGLRQVTEAAMRGYPNFAVVVTTLRVVRSATVNDWGAVAAAGGVFAGPPSGPPGDPGPGRRRGQLDSG